jgi:adenylate kinase family enzyme
MRRIVVVGSPGSGKTTVARQLAVAFGLTHIEFDHLHHRPGWTEASAGEFRAGLVEAMAGADDGWVTDGNYQARARSMHVDLADTVVWLDLPRRTIMSRLVRRTIRRAVTREKLFGRGLTEPLTNFFRWDPNKNIMRWAWVRFDGYRSHYEARGEDGSWAHLTVYRLRSPAEVAEFPAAAAIS